MADSSAPPASFFIRYEAESPLNILTYPVEGIASEGDTACTGIPGTPTDGVKEGAVCASGGQSYRPNSWVIAMHSTDLDHVVHQLRQLGRRRDV